MTFQGNSVSHKMIDNVVLTVALFCTVLDVQLVENREFYTNLLFNFKAPFDVWMSEVIEF